MLKYSTKIGKRILFHQFPFLVNYLRLFFISLFQLGIVTAGASVKGILGEVEYLPCVGVQACWSLLNEFAQGFLGSVVKNNTLPPYLKQKNPNQVYMPADTIHQYLDYFNTFRKTTSVGAGIQSNQSTPQR